jgi:hypothetical protein
VLDSVLLMDHVVERVCKCSQKWFSCHFKISLNCSNLIIQLHPFESFVFNLPNKHIIGLHRYTNIWVFIYLFIYYLPTLFILIEFHDCFTCKLQITLGIYREVLEGRHVNHIKILSFQLLEKT